MQVLRAVLHAEVEPRDPAARPPLLSLSLPFADCPDPGCVNHGRNAFEHYFEQPDVRASRYRRIGPHRLACRACGQRFYLGEALWVSPTNAVRKSMRDIIEAVRTTRAVADSIEATGISASAYYGRLNRCAQRLRDYLAWRQARLLHPKFARADQPVRVYTDTVHVSMRRLGRPERVQNLEIILSVVQLKGSWYILAAHAGYVPDTVSPDDDEPLIAEMGLPAWQAAWDCLRHPYQVNLSASVAKATQQLPNIGRKGLFTSSYYTELAHFLVVRKMLARFRSVHQVMDGSPALYTAALTAMAQDVRDRRVELVLFQYDKKAAAKPGAGSLGGGNWQEDALKKRLDAAWPAMEVRLEQQLRGGPAGAARRPVGRAGDRPDVQARLAGRLFAVGWMGLAGVSAERPAVPGPPRALAHLDAGQDLRGHGPRAVVAGEPVPRRLGRQFPPPAGPLAAASGHAGPVGTGVPARLPGAAHRRGRTLDRAAVAELRPPGPDHDPGAPGGGAGAGATRPGHARSPPSGLDVPARGRLRPPDQPVVAPVRPGQRHALVSVFVEFEALPELLALLVRERGYRWSSGATRGYGWGSYGGRVPDDEPPYAWQDFFRERPPNVDHIHDDPFDYLWSGEPDLVRALCEDAWALVRRLRLVVSHRLSRAGQRLADIGMRERPDHRFAEEYGILRQTLARQVERLYVGAERMPIVPMLRAAAVVLGQGGTRAAAHLPGLLAGEIAHLIERARTDATEALIGAHRLAAIREEVVQSLGEPDPGEEPSWYRVDLADAVNARNLAELPLRTEDAFTLTQVRATAQLLTFCGLLHEAYPLGPVQCLAAGR